MKKSKSKKLFFLEPSLLFFPIIYLLCIIFINTQNWGSTLYPEYIKFVSRAQHFTWVDGAYPLGYPVLLKGLFYIFRDYLLVGKFISLVSSFVVLYCVGKIAESLLTRRAGILSQIVLISFPTAFFWLSFTEGTDMPAVALFIVSLYFLLEESADSKKQTAFSGLFIGFAYLIRYPNLLFVSLFIVWILLRKQDIKSRIRLTGIYVLFFLLASSVQLIPSTLEAGNPFYNNFRHNLYFAMYGKENYPAYFGTDHGTVLQLLKNDFSGFMYRYFNELLRGMRSLSRLLLPALLGLFFVFVNKSMRIQTKQKMAFLMFLSLGFLSVVSAEFAVPRHLLPVIPLLSIPVGVLADMGLSRISKILKKPEWIDYMLVLLIVIFSFSFVQKVMKVDNSDVRWNRKISDVLLQNGMDSPHQVLCSSSNLHFHYSDTLERYDNFWWRKDWEKDNLARHKNMGLIEFEYFVLREGYRFVIFEGEGLRHLPNLGILFEENSLPDYWELIFKSEKQKLVIYKVAENILEKISLKRYRDLDVYRERLYLGFYEPEKWSAGIFRWSGHEGAIGLTRSGLFELTFHVSHPDIEKYPMTLDLFLDKNLIDKITFTRKGFITKKYYIPQRSEDVYKLLLKVSRTWNPYAYGISKDRRDLGVAVSEIEYLNEFPGNGIGFHNWETIHQGEIPGVFNELPKKFRWTGMRASIRVKSQPKRNLSIYIKPSHLDVNEKPMRVEVIGDKGQRIREVIFSDAQWKKLTLRYDELNDIQVLTFQVNRTWNPKLNGISKDMRDLGIAVAMPDND